MKEETARGGGNREGKQEGKSRGGEIGEKTE